MTGQAEQDIIAWKRLFGTDTTLSLSCVIL